MLLTGTYVRALDEKQRIAIPKTWRGRLQPAASDMVYLAPGTDHCLALYPADSFSKLAEQLGSASPHAQEVRAFRRLFFSQAQAAEVDGQGRLRIPTELTTWAGLGREAVLVGVQDHVELWDQARWQAYLAERQARFDQLAEAAFDPARSPDSGR